MYLVTNISGRVQSAPKTLVGIALTEQVNNWQIGQQDFVDDSVIQYYRGHSDVYTINAGPSLNPTLLSPTPATVPAGSVTAGETSVDTSTGLHSTVLTFNNVAVPVAFGTYGSGHLEALDFPQGLINVLGGTTNLTIARVGTGLGATAAVVGAIGTVAAADADDGALATTKANIIPSTAATLTAGAGAMPGKTTDIVVLDGTVTAIKAYLNFAVPSAGISGADTLTVNGTVTLVWANLGI